MSKLLLIQTLSPLHCGTGQSIGAVDLPIAREGNTALPLIPGSGLKGALRSQAKDLYHSGVSREDEVKVFGPETADASDHAGGLSFGDGRLLFLPVRSLRGTFAWITSPLLLSRLAQDCRSVGLPEPQVPHVDLLMEVVNKAYVGEESMLIHERHVYFEDLDLAAEGSAALTELASWAAARIWPEERVWAEMFKRRVCLVADDVLLFFARNAMEITTRVALDHETKTVKLGQLWTEEALPTESILVSLLTPTPGRKASAEDVSQLWSTLEKLTEYAVQIGGHATVGQGRCHLTLSGDAS